MTMSDSTEVVKEQYKNADKLNTRISIHEKYSINKMGFGNWILSNYDIRSGFKVLELGCGTGSVWKGHLDMLADADEVVFTDFSEGMLQTARASLGNAKNISYAVVDIQSIPYADDSFDVLIANMMLYHVPEIDKALAEVRRVLKPSGAFYCATYGENGIVKYFADLLRDFGVSEKLNKTFTLQNGGAMLQRHFVQVKRLDYEDSLEVTDLDDILDYIYSLTSMTDINNVDREVLKQILEGKIVNGVLMIPKEYGMFVCRA